MERTTVTRRRRLPPVPRPAAREAAPEPVDPPAGPLRDAAQQFVVCLRAAAPDFAAAAGAESAVVPAVVPPARHRRARCRVVLRHADGTDDDLTFLGPTGEPVGPSWHGFVRQIKRWLRAGRPRAAAWVVPDAGSADGLAVDVSAWLACREAR